jgi:hypothetical protein
MHNTINTDTPTQQKTHWIQHEVAKTNPTPPQTREKKKNIRYTRNSDRLS